jgi:hypothetical protein
MGRECERAASWLGLMAAAAAADRCSERSVGEEQSVSETEERVGGGEQSVSEQSVSEQSVSEQSVSEQSVAEQSVSEQSVSEQSVSEQSVSEQSVSEQSVSEQCLRTECLGTGSLVIHAVCCSEFCGGGGGEPGVSLFTPSPCCPMAGSRCRAEAEADEVLEAEVAAVAGVRRLSRSSLRGRTRRGRCPEAAVPILLRAEEEDQSDLEESDLEEVVEEGARAKGRVGRACQDSRASENKTITFLVLAVR